MQILLTKRTKDETESQQGSNLRPAERATTDDQDSGTGPRAETSDPQKHRPPNSARTDEHDEARRPARNDEVEHGARPALTL